LLILQSRLQKADGIFLFPIAYFTIPFAKSRRDFFLHLLQVKKYPAALIAVEKEILLGELKKRFDILVYNKEYQPWMMVECKAMEIKLDEMVLEQVLRYNISVPVEFMVITNGNLVYAWQKKDDELILINELPV